MELAWMMLTNHAEAPGNGLLYLSGATWDTVTVTGPPPPGAPEGVVAALQGMLVIRMRFHQTEVGIDYPMRITVIDEDGNRIADIEGEISTQVADDVPLSWS